MDEICEDILLEKWAPKGDLIEAPDFILVGDSQIGMLSDACTELGLSFAGGAIMQASHWHYQHFDLSPSFFTPTDQVAKERWADAFKRMRAGPQQVVITNIGLHSIMINNDFEGLVVYLTRKYGAVPETIPHGDVNLFLKLTRSAHLEILKRMVAAGHRVLWVTDPPSQLIRPDIFALIEHVQAVAVRKFGVEVFDARAWIESLGGFPERFKSVVVADESTGLKDWLHGSPEYYRELMRAIVAFASSNRA